MLNAEGLGEEVEGVEGGALLGGDGGGAACAVGGVALDLRGKGLDGGVVHGFDGGGVGVEGLEGGVEGGGGEIFAAVGVEAFFGGLDVGVEDREADLSVVNVARLHRGPSGLRCPIGYLGNLGNMGKENRGRMPWQGCQEGAGGLAIL